MKILLINNNPVVSRLTALSARKEAIELDEIQEVTELSSDKYDIVFVDADSLSKDVLDVISESINVQKKVLFFAQDDEEENGGFDITILKPFLPSEVSAVIKGLEESPGLFPNGHEAKIEEEFDLFDTKPEEKKEEILKLDDEIIDLPELEKVEEKKDIFDDLLKEETPIEEEPFYTQLEKAFPVKDNELEDDLFEDSKMKVDDVALKSNDDLFDLDLDDDKLSFDDEPLDSKPKDKELSLDNELLDFDFDNNDELDFDNEKVEAPVDNLMKDESKKEQITELNMVEEKEVLEPVKEPKILDASELANIKDILEHDVDADDNDMELSDLMTTPTPMLDMVEPVETKTSTKTETVETVKEKIEEKVEQEEKIEKEEECSEMNADVNLEALANLPIENLRKLLAGARVNISIKFPKD